MRGPLGIGLAILACLGSAPAMAESEPDPCGNARSAPGENVALYPPGPTLAVGSQLGVFVKDVGPGCLTGWEFEVEDVEGVQLFEGTTDYSDNALLWNPELVAGRQVEVRARALMGVEVSRTYTVVAEEEVSEPWALDVESPRFQLLGQHRRGGVKTMTASFIGIAIPGNSGDYATIRVDNYTVLGGVAPGWSPYATAEVERLPKDGEEACVIVEQRSPDGTLVDEHVRCGSFSISDLRRCACSTTAPSAALPWGLALALPLLRRRRRRAGVR